MKIRFKPRLNKHPNDCWCDAVTFATHRPYDEIYELLKPFIDKDGLLTSAFTNGVLFDADYEYWNVTEVPKPTIRETILHVNTYDNECVMHSGKHMFYVRNATIYDNIPIEQREKHLDSLVDYYFLREVKL